MATKTYKQKKLIPYWVEPIIGRANYKKLQRGNSVSLSTDLRRGIFEFLVEAPTKPVDKKTPKTKEKK